VEPLLRDLFLVDCATRTETVERQLYTTLIALADALDVDVSGLARNHDEEDDALQALDTTRRGLLERLR
jgi:hypothetical protein